MTAPSAVTKQSLIEEVGALKAKLAEIENRPTYGPPRPVAVPEAIALADCIRALDALASNARETNRYSSSNYQQDAANPVKRTLVALAAKYSLPLVETKWEPCARQHVDQLHADQILFALRNTAVQS